MKYFQKDVYINFDSLKKEIKTIYYDKTAYKYCSKTKNFIRNKYEDLHCNICDHYSLSNAISFNTETFEDYAKYKKYTLCHHDICISCHNKEYKKHRVPDSIMKQSIMYQYCSNCKKLLQDYLI